MHGDAGSISPRARIACHALIAPAALVASAATAQRAPDPQPSGAKAESEIVVTASRGAVKTDAQPIATFNAQAIAATGASTIAELLRTIRAVTQSADGGDPIFLLNAQRVSGYQEIGTLPPEAIEKVEVLPEPVALQFGFPPTRRVVNFITKRRFAQTELRASAGTTTRSGSRTANQNYSLTKLRDDARLTLSLEHRHTGRLLQSERDILPDPDILFDGIGNVTGVNGREIDPALSSLAGEVVTAAPVPDASADRATLDAYAANANRPRAFDLGSTRSLLPRNEAWKFDTVLADRIGKHLAGSISLTAERSRDLALAGPAPATLVVPANNPFSPFSGPVLLSRYLVEADPLRQHQTTTTLHAGATLRGAIAGWRWDLTASLDQQRNAGISEQAIDLSAPQAAIDAGADPFVQLDPALLRTRLVDHARLRTRTANAKIVVTNAPVHLPAGAVTVTATAEIEHADADAVTRGVNPFALDLGRGRAEGALAIDLPIASARADVLPFLGELSANASANVRRVGGFGTLFDRTAGLSWGPLPWLQLLGQAKRSGAAPGLQQLASPAVTIANVPAFDFATGRTDLVTATTGGNPDLAAEHRQTNSLTLTVKPFPKRELRLSATYEATRIHNQTGTIYAVTPQIEAILPDLLARDADGRLVSITFQPRNFFLERQRTLNIVISGSGSLGKPPPKAADGNEPSRPFLYAGLGPTIKFSDRLQLAPGTPAFDLLHGDTITGGGNPRAFGYAYGGLGFLGNDLTFDCWYGGSSRVRSDNPAADLRFAPIFKLNLGGSISIHHFTPKLAWTQHLSLKLNVSNVTDARQRVRDGNGAVPNRYQPDYLDPIGRTVTLTLRKLL